LIVSLLWSTVGCSSDSDDEPKGTAGSSGAGGSGDGDVSPISVPTCLAYCEHYQAACGQSASVCDAYCELVKRSPAKCAKSYDSFFECGTTATIDCDDPLGTSPSEGCGYDDLKACVSGPSCNRFTDADAACEKNHPGTVGYFCTREDAAGCVPLDPDSTSRKRCCPPE
jgi:hypothetical protein